MAIRGTLAAALAVVAAGLSPVAAAPAPAHAVWEVYRPRAVGAATVSLRVSALSKGRPGLIAFAELAPQGRGYRANTVGIGLIGLGDTRWRTYGWPAPVPAPPCPGGTFCGSRHISAGHSDVLRFAARKNHRYLIGGPRDTTKVTVHSYGWKVRRTTLALRTVLAEQADSIGLVTGEGTVERFGSASAPGGPHGSLVFAETPCDAGVRTLTHGADSYGPELCSPLILSFQFRSAATAGTWRLTGETVGRSLQPFRLVVLDYPKR